MGALSDIPPERLREAAAKAMARGAWEQALAAYQELVSREPGDPKLWVAVAEICCKLGRNRQAVQLYAKAAAQYAADGEPMRAIALNRRILAIDPGHRETETRLAALYSGVTVKKKRELGIGSTPKAAPAASQSGSSAGKPPMPSVVPVSFGPKAAGTTAATPSSNWANRYFQPSPEEFARALSEHEGGRVSTEGLFRNIMAQQLHSRAGADGSNFLAGLPEIPLFSELSPNAFREILRLVDVRTFAPGEAVVREGEVGDSFYVLTDGRLRVTKKDTAGGEIVLATLGPGDFFGEFAFLTGNPRAASVVADEPAETLVFSRAALSSVIRDYPDVGDALERFYSQRVVANTLKVNPVLQLLPPNLRDRLLPHFQWAKRPAGVTLMDPSDRSSVLWIVVAGRVAATAATAAGGAAARALLKDGDFFGCLPTTMSSQAPIRFATTTETRLFRLRGELLDRLVERYPEIPRLIDERMRKVWADVIKPAARRRGTPL